MGRAAAFLAAFFVGSCSTWATAEWAIARGGFTRQTITFDIIRSVRDFQRRVLTDETHERIAFLGDSVLISADGEPSVPSATELTLHERGERVTAIHTLPIPGASVVSEYFLADEILRAKPDRIVLEINLWSLGPTPLGPYSFSELAGWLSTSRLAEAAALPLSEAGLTLNRLLFYRLLVATGWDGVWTFVVDRQAKLYDARDTIETALDEKLSRRSLLERRLRIGLERISKTLVPGQFRMRGELLSKVFENPLSGLSEETPRIRFLLALLDRFRDAGIPTLLWVSPVNVQHLAEQGVDPAPLTRSMNALARLVELHGATLLDLHALLRDPEFRDYSDHLQSTGAPPATIRVGRLIARAIATMNPGKVRAGLGSESSRGNGNALQ